MKTIFVHTILSLSFLICCLGLGCVNPVNFDYSIKQKADLSNLLIFEYGQNIVGIDTADFSVKAHIRIDDMAFGGVAKLPSGGIAFTHHRKGSNNTWGNSLYVTDRNCNLLNTYTICDSPMSPKVINNRLLVGSSAIDPGITFKFQIYDTDNFYLKKEYQFRGDIEAWQIASWGDKAYFGIQHEGSYPNPEYSYVVELDLNTLDTINIGDSTDFFLDAFLVTVRQDTLLYIFDVQKKNTCVYDLVSKSIQRIVNTGEYPQIVALNAQRLTLPYIHNNFLYCLLARNDISGTETSHLAKFDLPSLNFVKIIDLEVHKGYIRGAHKFYMGDSLVRQFEKNVTFTNIETGRIEKNVSLDMVY